ncbi:MAG: hypothetical protein R2708_03585 [Vicinamibacterales bacterium]
MPTVPGSRGVQTVTAALGYAVLTVVMTWPIAAGLGRDVPADLGDSLLNMWLMAWGAEAFVAMTSGTMSFADFWNGNIFHPAPATLTFSDHLAPQALQGLPFYLATGNVVLAYDIVFLATFVLSGLGMFLFVRELTGSARAAFVAGLFFAFVPYRVGQYSHIQTLSSQWMPVALFGLRRYFDRGSVSALAGGAAAFALQGLSTGYYLFYFAPVFAGYVLWEIAARGRWRDGRMWVALGAAGGGVLAATLPFLLPYARARAALGLARPYEEVLAFSADLFAWMNVNPHLRLWGPLLNGHPQPEGDLFPGAVPLLLALLAVGLWTVRARRESRGVPMGRTPAAAWMARALLAVAVVVALAAPVIAITGGFVWDLGGVLVRATNVQRALAVAAMAVAAGVMISPRWRAAVRLHPSDLTPFFLAAVLFAVVMSLGPAPRAGGVRLSGLELYRVFFDYVPGFDGLRVPARFAMVGAAMLAPLAAYALLPLTRRGAAGTAGLALVAALFLGEAYGGRVDQNVTWVSSSRYEPAWPAVYRLNDGPLAYRHLLAMPASTVVLELPFGDAAWDLRYVYYAGLHGRRIVNGYSGYFPAGYQARAARLANLRNDRDDAWQAVVESRATHVLLHLKAYRRQDATTVAEWLSASGARPIVAFDDGDMLYRLPGR